MPKFVLPVIFVLALVAALATIVIVQNTGGGEELVLYSGRSQSLVRPAIEQFEEQSGMEVSVRYGDTTELATTLLETEQSEADVFWAQDATALGALASGGRFAELPEDLVAQVPQRYRSPERLWIGTSGRARVLAYSTERVEDDELPESVFDLTDEQYAGRVAWAPTNGSFQAFVTAMRHVHGDERTLEWLNEMDANDPNVQPNNSSILEAIAAGEADFGITNHYYLLRELDNDPEFPVAQTSFADGDIGNLINVAGTGVIEGASNEENAHAFIAFLLENDIQDYFVTETFEYPVIDEAGDLPEQAVQDPQRLREAAPDVNIDELDDLNTTLEMIEQAGLI